MDVRNNINIRLVQAVQKYPCLYDSSLPEHYKLESTEEAWIDVAIELSSTPDLCKDRWRCFRSIFFKSLKQMQMGKLVKPYYLHDYMQFLIPYLPLPRNQEKRAKRFLADSKRQFANNNKHTKANVDNGVAFEYSTDSTVQENYDFTTAGRDLIQQQNHSSNNRKRGMSTAFEKTDHFVSNEYEARQNEVTSTVRNHSENWEVTVSDEDDPKRLFLLSLLPDLEEMDIAQMRLFKRKVTTLVNEIFNDTIT